MTILCTFPGKFGDLLWALPTLRALALAGHEVHLLIPQSLASIGELLRGQGYIRDVLIDATWTVMNTAPASPRIPPNALPKFEHVCHLGYRQWPEASLPVETLHCYIAWRLADFERQETFPPLTEADLHLSTPWIQSVLPHRWDFPWVHGFTDEHFELKYGIVDLLIRQHRRMGGGMTPVRIGSDPRWNTEAGETDNTWLETAELLQGAKAFLGCNSALHVLAVAMGVPVVMMEPNPHRHHWIFYPVGDQGPQVQLVRGIDGNPTFDARHVKDALANALAARVDSATP